MRKVFFIVVLFSYLLVACNNSDSTEKLGEEFLEGKDYEVVSYEGEADKYEFTQSMLLEQESPYRMQWSVQKTENLKSYINETVVVEEFLVNNHPLADSDEATIVRLFFIGDEIVGGISAPMDGEEKMGPVRNIYGKTFDEVHSMSKEEWEETWNNLFQ